jgi:hypothetical protein
MQGLLMAKKSARANSAKKTKSVEFFQNIL